MTMCPHCLSEKVRNDTCLECRKNVNSVKRDPRSLAPQTVIRRQFVIGKQLGAGGFGITYLAYDKMLNQKIAIKEYMPKKVAARDKSGEKVMPISDAHLPAFTKGKEQFIEEARTIAQFRHENIVPIQACFEANNTAYFVMPYVRGISLAELILKRQGVPESELLDIFNAILNGLEVVHKKGVWHRDIKPANIYIPEASDEQPFLLDFGAARQAVRSNDPMSILLTHGYAPLEQYSSSSAQAAFTDIYAVGATMYSCLKGDIQKNKILPPPSAERRANGEELPEISKVAKGKVKASTSNAIMKAMEMNPSDRPSSVAEFRSILFASSPPPPERKPAPMHYELVCLAGQYEGERIPLDSRHMIIGRSMGEVSLWVEAKTVSRQHCGISVQNDQVILEDLGAVNGTFVNGTNRLQKRATAVLNEGDNFTLAGSIVFELQKVPGPTSEAGDHEEGALGPSTYSPTRELDRVPGSPFSQFFKQLFTVQGRLNRAKYLAVIGVLFGFSLLLEAFRWEMSRDMFALVYFSYCIVSTVISVMAGIRRFHDIGKKGQYYFWLLVPLVNLYWICLLLFKKGDSADNQFGPDPIGRKFLEL